VNRILLVGLAAFALLAGYSLVELVLDRAAFGFGSEVGGWRYRSVAHYVGLALAELGVALAGIAAPRMGLAEGRVPVVRGACLALLIIGIFAL